MKEKISYITIESKKYEIIDALESITLADSFVKNKIGTGHGEAKLYVGNENQRLVSFFGDFSGMCFFAKKDLKIFLADSELEFKNPQQQYVKKNEMNDIFNALSLRVDGYTDSLLYFQLYRVNVEPPRVYVNSNSEYYDFMRSVGLPNISYVSVLKIKDKEKIFFYFKIFINYSSDIVTCIMPEDESEQNKILSNTKIPERKKTTLIQARIGQGQYRLDVIEQCPYCPFTMVNDERLLIASHIKPWNKSDDKEKVDPKNGFMFTPTFDKLFDRGFITFDDNKKLIVSPWLSPMNQKRLGIYTGKNIGMLPLDEKRIKYLKYHREYVFKT